MNVATDDNVTQEKEKIDVIEIDKTAKEIQETISDDMILRVYKDSTLPDLMTLVEIDCKFYLKFF